jgi:hypothetical protein
MSKKAISAKQSPKKLERIRLKTHMEPSPTAKAIARGIGAPQGNAVMHGDEVMVLFRGGYIRNHRRFHDDAHINITFSIKTGNNSYSYTFGTFEVDLDKPLPFQNVVLLPLTKVEDHFSIVINMIQESALKLAQSNISQTLTVANNIIANVPVIGIAGSTAIGIIGDLISLVISLSPENALISEGNTYIVDQKRYPHIIDKQLYPNSGLDYLRLGTLIFYENGYYYQGGKFYEDSSMKQGNPTRLVLELIKPMS